MSIVMDPDKRVGVLQVCTILLTGKVFIAPVARYLSNRGFEVSIACSMTETLDGPVTAEGKGIDGVPVHHIPIPRRIKPIQDFRAAWHLYKLIRRLKPTIVHTQTSKAGVVGRLAAWLAGTPIVVHTAHAFPFHPYLPRFLRRLYVVIERFSARFADLVIVDTESVRADGLREGIADEQKLVVVPMGLDLSKFVPGDGDCYLRQTLGLGKDDFVIGTVARLVPDKGLDCFLRMAAEILRVRPEVRFLVVGEGPLRQSLERQVSEFNIADSVTFLGHRGDVPALMEIIDLFVLPTRREGFGMVFAEAMAMGKAVIGSRIRPVAEVVEDNISGYLVPMTDHKEFAKRALELLVNSEKRLSFGRAGRKRVEKFFNEEMMCETIERHYRSLMVSKGPVI